jgi:hypothetical protein
MTYNELLAKIDYAIEGNPYDEYIEALRAVVELHSYILYKNTETDEMYEECHECSGNGYHELYPCATIQAIERKLK